MTPLDNPTLSVSDHDVDPGPLTVLRDLEKKVLWLSSWMIHHANSLRENSDGMKVGGHQASSASVTALMTALYFHELRPTDRVAVKPHASPVFHAIQYLLGNQSLENLKNFRAFGGAQSYPSRTKDADDVDISTGSVGLGPAMTVFASLVQDYLRRHLKSVQAQTPGRMIAVVGDAEMDEGNMYEALLEGWKHDLRNCWWIIDYNRQSLDGVVRDRLFRWIDRTFRGADWTVVTLKYGKRMMAAFEKPGGKVLKHWIRDCPNDVYSALTFQGGKHWRVKLTADIGHEDGVGELLASYDDDALQDLMTNLGGHCLETILEAFASIADDKPACFIAYTIKGHGLPLAGHKDNHAGIMNAEQVAYLRQRFNIDEGDEWLPFAGLNSRPEDLSRFLGAVPFNAQNTNGNKGSRRKSAAPVPVPTPLPLSAKDKTSTQEAFGKILFELAGTDDALADRIVTASPDVTQSTGLGGWVNRRGLFARDAVADTFKAHNVLSAQKWGANDAGQHIELGIAENNLFLMLGAMGLSHELFGERLLPIGTVYDPFIQRGLDALNYACYQDSRFMLVATPSGLSLAPEGGAHQSIATPLIGIGQPGLASFEPAYADELREIMGWGFGYMQDADGGAVYLRLSTLALEQPKRRMTKALRRDLLAGAYWQGKPGKKGAIIYSGALAKEAKQAHDRLGKEGKSDNIGLLAVTSADRLFSDWRAKGRGSHLAKLLSSLSPDARLVTVLDGHPAALSWIGSVAGHWLRPLGVEQFGQCGDLNDLYSAYGIDARAIEGAFKEP
ncbi:MAG TPA: transketolase [Rhodospirillales bacterium]|jgi:pyruvate dehydrogenase E1 component|nr:MAG: Pyruvate dehydrogenase E1 component [Alphaproteobacteria bacterium MarineAlpha3_Bin2]HIM26120.1 transketolase [Rhodospirillales bacterium]